MVRPGWISSVPVTLTDQILDLLLALSMVDSIYRIVSGISHGVNRSNRKGRLQDPVIKIELPHEPCRVFVAHINHGMDETTMHYYQSFYKYDPPTIHLLESSQCGRTC
jgi:hypothetical protein